MGVTKVDAKTLAVTPEREKSVETPYRNVNIHLNLMLKQYTGASLKNLADLKEATRTRDEQREKLESSKTSTAHLKAGWNAIAGTLTATSNFLPSGQTVAQAGTIVAQAGNPPLDDKAGREQDKSQRLLKQNDSATGTEQNIQAGMRQVQQSVEKITEEEKAVHRKPIQN